MRKFLSLSSLGILALMFSTPSFAACPILTGKFTCPGIMTIGAFDIEIKQTPGEGFMEYIVELSGGQTGIHVSRANSSGMVNPDGHTSTCAGDKIVIKTINPTLGEVEGQVYKGAGDTVRVTLLGATPEPWEALVCNRK